MLLLNALESSKTLTFAFPSVVCHVVLVVCSLFIKLLKIQTKYYTCVPAADTSRSYFYK